MVSHYSKRVILLSLISHVSFIASILFFSLFFGWYFEWKPVLRREIFVSYISLPLMLLIIGIILWLVVCMPNIKFSNVRIEFSNKDDFVKFIDQLQPVAQRYGLKIILKPISNDGQKIEITAKEGD